MPNLKDTIFIDLTDQLGKKAFGFFMPWENRLYPVCDGTSVFESIDHLESLLIEAGHRHYFEEYKDLIPEGVVDEKEKEYLCVVWHDDQP